MARSALLGAVVEVPLDPAALVQVRGGEPGPRLGDLLDLSGQLRPQPDVVDLRGCGRGPPPRPRRGQ